MRRQLHKCKEEFLHKGFPELFPRKGSPIGFHRGLPICRIPMQWSSDWIPMHVVSIWILENW
eukprot:7445324-Pyramimonas_sp.AAC.1